MIVVNTLWPWFNLLPNNRDFKKNEKKIEIKVPLQYIPRWDDQDDKSTALPHPYPTLAWIGLKF